MNETSQFHTASDGVSLHELCWTGDAHPTAIVHIAHGLAEHAARYARVAQALTTAGFVVYANDHRGHGKTASSAADLGFFADEDGWSRCVDDLHEHIARHRAAHPGLPVVLFGHSMGSLMTQQYMYQYGDTIDAAVLSGSNGAPPALAKVGRLIARVERLRQGKRGKSSLIDMLAFGKFNQAFKPNRTTFDWLSRDEAEVDKYIADPLCGFLATNQLWIDLLDAMPVYTHPHQQAKIPSRLPIYVFAGSEDPVSEGTKSLRALLASYQQVGLSAVSHRFYDGGRHEMLNESNRDEVTADLVTWLTSAIAKE